MSLDHAILGLLMQRPASGYDLKKAFDSSLQHFWPADQSQIYRTLARLAEQGLLDVQRVEQTERPDRKVYQVTPAGQTELRRWLAGPVPPPEPRSAPLVQIFFAGQLSNDEVAAKFAEIAALMRANLARLDGLRDVINRRIETVGTPRDAFFWMQTLDLGEQMAETQLDWAERALERFGNLDSEDVPRRPLATQGS